MKNMVIYQLKKEYLREYGFRTWDMINSKNNIIDMKRYDGIYDFIRENSYTLDDCFCEFNLNHPHGFKGHSLSVSDVIEVNGELYYIDGFGFKRVKEKL